MAETSEKISAFGWSPIASSFSEAAKEAVGKARLPIVAGEKPLPQKELPRHNAPLASLTGAAMFLKTATVKAHVKEVYLDYPSTRGDDRLLIWRYLRRFHPNIRLTFKQFDELRSIPSFETIRRRGQELRAEIPALQPKERTQQKRYRRSEAFRHYYGDGQLHVSDFARGD